MKKSLWWVGAVAVTGIVFALGTIAPGEAIEAIKKDDRIKQMEFKPQSECGAMEFDRVSGSMRRKPNVDLVVSKIEIVRNERGTWVTPWIKNRCSGNVTGTVNVSIGEVVVSFSGLTPQVEVSLGHAVGVAPALSHTVVVDYDDRIAEANETNNRCTRSTTGNCP